MSSFKFDAETGEVVVASTQRRIAFLPDEPAQSPPYELVDTQDPDDSTLDGHTHYLIGGDPKVVDQIVAFYQSKGKKVPANYAAEAAAHAALVEATKQQAS